MWQQTTAGVLGGVSLLNEPAEVSKHSLLTTVLPQDDTVYLDKSVL